MADNIRDVYSVVFESLGEQKLVQDLNKIKAAIDSLDKSFKKIGELQGLSKTFDANGKDLKRSLNEVVKTEELKEKAVLKRLDTVRKVSNEIISQEQKEYQAKVKMYGEMFNLIEKQTQKKIEAERLYNQQFQKLLTDEKEARAKMAAYVAADVAKDKAAKLKAADEYRQAFAKLQAQEIAAAQKAAEEKFKIQQAYSLKTIQMNEWQKQAFAQRTTQQLQGFFDNKAMTANNAAAWGSMKNVVAKGSELEGHMQLYAQRIKANEAEKQKLETQKKQTAEMTKQGSLLTSFKKSLQKFGTDSFVFQRMFDSVTRTLDEWSKMSIAMSQFRASANFENMNRQLDETVVKLGNVISKYEMIPAINKAKMLGMDFSGNKLSETLEMTTKVSQMFGMDSTKAFGDFTVALSKASPIIMDNVGVLLRLEESYKLFYDRQYKGKESFDKWSESLTQAEKRTIYYKEAMRLLSEKTEGVAVKTNEVQSVLMKLKDAWYKLGTDLEDAGSLNPLIWALEKIVSLAEGVANTFMTISDGYKALQYSFPTIFGTPDIEFKAKEVSDIYANRKKAIDSIKEKYTTEEEAGKQLYEKLAKYQSKYYDSIQENRRKKDAVIINKDYSKTRPEQYIERDAWLDSQIQEDTKKYEELSDVMFKLNERRKEGNVLTEDTIKLLSPYLKGLDESYQRAKKISELDNKTMETGYEKFIKRPMMDFQNVLNTDDVTAKIQWAIVAKEKIVELDKQLATSQKLSTYALGEYNTKFEKLKNNIKARYQDEQKMTPEQIKNLEKIKKLGALTSLAQYDFVVGADSERDFAQGFQVATTKARSKDDPKYKDVIEKSFKKMLENNELSIPELVEFNKQNKKQLDELLKTYTDAQKANLRGDVDFRMQTTDSLKDKVIEALTINIEDKQKIEETREWVEEQYKLWKDLSKSGSAVGLFNNFVNMLLQNQETKTSGTGRSKAPKEFWDKWYEMNRTAFTETLPEGITRDIEQARLDWFDQTKNLENLKKDILKAKREGRLDPEENLKFFGGRKDNSLFESQMKAYTETIEDNYRKMLDNLAEELKRKQDELNPFQQFVKDKRTETLTTKGDLLSKEKFIGTEINYAALQNVQGELNSIKRNEELKKINNEYYETQKRIKTELQAQKTLTDMRIKQSYEEWGNTEEFHKEKKRLLDEYATKEQQAMEELNEQYGEKVGYAHSLLHNVDLLNSAIDYQLEQQRKITDEVYKQGDIVAKYNRENMKALSAMANKNMDITAYGFNAMGFGENEQSIAMKQANMQEKIYRQMASSSQFKDVAKRMMTVKTDTAFNFELDPSKMMGMTDEEKARLQQEAEVMKSIFQDVANSIIQSVTTASEVWKGMLQEMFSNVANFAGNMAWNAITGEDVSGVQALREARKTDLKDQQENLKNKSITQETYAKRAYEIEKTYIENKKAAEKNYRNEQWKQLGAVFWAQGMGYMIKGGIDMFINPAAGQAELAGGAALMALGAMLGYGRGGKKAMSKANMAEESKATKQDINVYVDNKIFEDKRQLRQAINNASV